MAFRTSICLISLYSCLNLSAFSQAARSPAGDVAICAKGAVVDMVTKNSAADLAGIEAEDTLLYWTQGNARGVVESPFHLSDLEIERSPLGIVRIEGKRRSVKHTWFLKQTDWGLTVRPNLSPSLLKAYREAQGLLLAGKPADATERLRQASAVASTSKFSWLSSWFLSVAAAWMDRNPDRKQVNELYQEAIVRAAAAPPAVRAVLFRQWAISYEYHSDSANAEKYYGLELAEREELGSYTNGIAYSLLDLGVVASMRGDLNAAAEDWHKSLAIEEKIAPRSRIGMLCVMDLGALSLLQGNLAQAEGYFRRAQMIGEKFFVGSDDLAAILTNLGVLAHTRGDLEEAGVYHRRAVALLERSKTDTLDLADSLGSYGEYLLESKHPDKAEKCQTRALAIREKLAPDSLAVATTLLDLGRIARFRGELAKAEEYFQRAVDIAERGPRRSPRIPAFFIAWGDLSRERRDFGKAEDLYRHALALMDKLTPTSLDHGQTLAALADTMRQEGKLDAASQLYRQALNDMGDKVSELSSAGEDRSLYRAKHRLYYSEYVDLLQEQGQPDLAFQTLEGSRARTLLEILNQGQIDVREGADPTLLARKKRLEETLRAKSSYRWQTLTGSRDSEQLAALEVESERLRDEYRALEAEIRVKSPAYAALTQPPFLSTKEIQQLLDSQSVLLEYSLGDGRSHVWLVSENSVSAYELPKRAEIERLAREFYGALTGRTHRMSADPEVAETRWTRSDALSQRIAIELSRMLLGPVADQIAGKRLLIVSDGILQYLPFAALSSPENPGVPLVVYHEIVNLPSASVVSELRRAREGRRQPSREVAVLADPVFDSQDERVVKEQHGGNHSADEKVDSELPSRVKISLAGDRLTRSVLDVGLGRNGRFRLPRLLYTQREANMIAAVTTQNSRMVAVDFEASRATAMSAKLAQYRIVHFATHGLLDSKHPEFSGLVFSLVDRHGRPQDGFLQLQDIYNLNLPVDLVVLSGCETGLGEEIDGEGLIGLTRGFMYAGASRVVASLWSVSDEATSELMARFYKGMETQKMRPAAALRAAQIEMWKQKHWRSPYYWAAFQIHGEWQ